MLNPKGLENSPHRIIYHDLLSLEANKGAPVPSAKSLYEEAQALMFGGGDTTANAIMLGNFNLLENPIMVRRLKLELLETCTELEKPPRYEELEKLPLLVRT